MNALVKALLLTSFFGAVDADEEGTGNMVKMCLFYPNPSGHARSDPIITQNGLSDHVHTVSSIPLISFSYLAYTVSNYSYAFSSVLWTAQFPSNHYK